MISIQTADFDISHEVNELRSLSLATGAIVSFSGLVREIAEQGDIQSLFLEHYPGMTEASIQRIVDTAAARWELLATRVIHRVGRLLPGDQIVLVVTSSKHREDAFAAAEFIMDYLKTRAPFWKKECSDQGEQWLGTRDSDFAAAERWNTGN